MINNANIILHDLQILNLNINGIKKDRNSLITFLQRKDIDVACITETHLAPKENFTIPGYKIYRNDRDNCIASGGVAILIKKKFTNQQLPLINCSNIEIIGIEIILTNNSTLNIFSAYKQPNKPLIEEDIKLIFNTNRQTLLLGDINSKNTAWGCRANNQAGIKLLNFAAIYNFMVHAPNTYTYYPYRNDYQPDILDIALTKNFNKLINQEVVVDLDSDHLPVILSFRTSPCLIKNNNKLLVTNWLLFKNTFENHFNDSGYSLNTQKSIDQSVQLLTEKINICIKQSSFPKCKPQFDNYLPSYEIQSLINQKNSLRREWQSTRNPATKSVVNRLTRQIRKELEAYRIKSFQRYLNNIESNNLEIWKATRRISRKSNEVSTLNTDNGVLITDQQKCTGFAEYLEKTFRPHFFSTPSFTTSVLAYNENHNPVLNDNFQKVKINEIRTIIKNLKTKKAPGPDQISNLALKNLPEKGVHFLKRLFNACMEQGYFPSCWKHAHILMFLKPGKPKSKITSYRPISLLSTLSKILEKIINLRLCEALNVMNVIPHFQFGFRNQFSTSHQLQRLSNIIERGFEMKQYSTALFLDVAQAFDRVWINGLIYKILHLDLDINIKQLLISFLKDRSFSVKIHESFSETKKNFRWCTPRQCPLPHPIQHLHE